MNCNPLPLALAAACLGAPWLARAEGPAGATITPAEILVRVDKAQGDFEDLTTESKLVVREPGQATGREYQFVTISKGSEKRIVRFLSPGDVKGMGMLIEGRDTMYAFLPGFQRVRRLGTHVKNQTFMGSDVSTEDMAAFKMAEVYDARLVGEEEGNYVVEVTARPGKEVEFPRRKLWIDKKIFQPVRLEDYDAKGVNVRSTTRTDYRRDEGPVEHWTPFRMTIIDHRRNDHTTELLMTSARVNQKVKDDAFSQRQLVRGQ